jgi:hypothetical protein
MDTNLTNSSLSKNGTQLAICTAYPLTDLENGYESDPYEKSAQHTYDPTPLFLPLHRALA